MYLIYETSIKTFISELLKWTLPFLDLDLSTDANSGFSLKSFLGISTSLYMCLFIKNASACAVSET